jgi:hypothetical protein
MNTKQNNKTVPSSNKIIASAPSGATITLLDRLKNIQSYTDSLDNSIAALRSTFGIIKEDDQAAPAGTTVESVIYDIEYRLGRAAANLSDVVNYIG